MMRRPLATQKRIRRKVRKRGGFLMLRQQAESDTVAVVLSTFMA